MMVGSLNPWGVVVLRNAINQNSPSLAFSAPILVALVTLLVVRWQGGVPRMAGSVMVAVLVSVRWAARAPLRR